MPLISISKAAKKRLDRVCKIDRRTQGNVIDILLEEKLKSLGLPTNGDDLSDDDNDVIQHDDDVPM